ncbi:MAG: hypothetical protein LBC59_01935 [Chitinispirillales bacterium]|jgi:hypothetical protein|nr:hypothetical protein [Chitinispirillales bacterium]
MAAAAPRRLFALSLLLTLVTLTTAISAAVEPSYVLGGAGKNLTFDGDNSIL